MATVTTSRPRRLRARRLQREEVARPLRRRADLSGASVGTARGRCALAGLSRPGPLAVPDNARMETLADDDGEVHIQRVHIVASAILCQPAVHHLGEAHNCSSSEVETRARGSAVPGRAVPADQQRFPFPLAQNPFDVLQAEPLRGVFSLSQPRTRRSRRRELARPELWVANVLVQTFPRGTPDQSRLPVVLREQVVQEVRRPRLLRPGRVARFCCLKEPPNRNRSGARIPLNTATPFAVHQMLDRNSYVVTGTERAMMLIMVTTAAMMVVERFSFSGRPGESRSPQIQKELSVRRRSSAASDCYAPEAASDCYAPEAASPGLHPPSCVLAPPAGIGGAACAS